MNWDKSRLILRVRFSGWIDPGNRRTTLYQLAKLLLERRYNLCQRFAARSYHPGGVNTLSCDGSGDAPGKIDHHRLLVLLSIRATHGSVGRTSANTFARSTNTQEDASSSSTTLTSD